MIPLRDVNRARTVPVVNYVLIGLNSLVFIYELLLGPELEAFFYEYGFIPRRFFEALWYLPTVGVGVFLGQVMTLFTSMFIHGGWVHFLGNMWFLHIFGDNVEDRMGHGRYLAFYLLTGLTAGLAQGVLSMGSGIPSIGASGAISGVMGAYLRFFPGARVLTLVPVFFFYEMVEIPAFVYLFFWFVLQFFQGTFSLAAGTAGAGGVAWWAHIGGFVGGLLLARVFMKRKYRYPYIEIVGDDRSWPYGL